MWIADDKKKLLASFEEVKGSEQRMEVDNGNSVTASEEENKEEQNSGITFPGYSVEPYVGSALTINDHDFTNEVIVVEISSPRFAYKYEDTGRVYIGQCEFCNMRNVLAIECKCKRVRYCKESCRKKDENFHLPTCSAQADDELNKVSVQKRSDNSKDGIVGL